MYVTRPLSLYKNSPNAALEQPEGPNSGVLVIQDAEWEAQATSLWGIVRNNQIYDPPFPQNRVLTVQYSTGVGEDQATYHDTVFFIPVINRPLSSNRYYVITGKGRHTGKTCTSSTEEEMRTCCFCRCVNDVKPSSFDYRNINQQMVIICHSGEFYAKSAAFNAYPPSFLRKKHWEVYTSVQDNYYLGKASGVNLSLRSRMPELNISISTKHSAAMVVGKWYCPFIFVKEGGSLRDQMKSSMFYEMTLQQFWEEIYTCENHHGREKVVKINVDIQREMALLYGSSGVEANPEVVDGVMWFRPINSISGGLGLSLPIWERVRWEQDRGGWVGNEEKVERMERVEEFGGECEWNKFGCYVLVERFVLKRMDGSFALIYDFKHTNKIRTKWE